MISYHFCDLLLHSNWFQCQWLFKPYQHHQLLYHCHCCHHSKKQPQQPPSQPHHHYQQQMPASISKYVIFALYALQYTAFIFLSWFLSRAMARRAISLERKMLMICWMRLKVCTGLCYSHHLVALGLVCAWNWCTHPAHFVHIVAGLWVVSTQLGQIHSLSWCSDNTSRRNQCLHNFVWMMACYPLSLWHWIPIKQPMPQCWSMQVWFSVPVHRVLIYCLWESYIWSQWTLEWHYQNIGPIGTSP